MAILLTLIALGWALLQLAIGYRDYEEAERQTNEALVLRGRIMLYDEVLTMSARMAAATGDPIWEHRYRQCEPMLDHEIRLAVNLFPGSQVAAITDEANQKLVALEHQALSLAKTGNLSEAQKVFNAEYRHQKEVYAAGMSDFNQALRARAQANLEQRQMRLKGLSLACAGISAAMLLTWLAIIYHTQAWNRTLLDKNQALDRQSEEIQQANFKLAESQAKLFQAQKLELVGTLASGVAHDFNNQLVPIFGHVELMLAEDRTPAQRASLDVIQAAAKNCRQLVRRLMSLGNPSTSEKMTLDVIVLMNELKEFLVQTLPSTIRLELLIEGNVRPILGTVAEVQAVFLNLATNARDAMPEGGHLRLTVRNLADQVQFCVEDDGMGMSAEIQAKIFDPFFTTKAGHAGTGLGLSSVKRALEDHGGSIEVDSRPGAGSRFTLTFPAVLSNPPDEPTSQATPESIRIPRILFVDDEAAIRRVASRRMATLGVEVITAADGFEALECYDPHEIDAVVSDVTMPKMDGLKLLQRLLEINPKVLVFLVSGNDVEVSQAPGVAAILAKPYQFQELVNTVVARLRHSNPREIKLEPASGDLPAGDLE